MWHRAATSRLTRSVYTPRVEPLDRGRLETGGCVKADSLTSKLVLSVLLSAGCSGGQGSPRGGGGGQGGRAGIGGQSGQVGGGGEAGSPQGGDTGQGTAGLNGAGGSG